MVKKFEHEIEVKGHLIDSMILTKIFDVIMDLNGEFQVQEFRVGKRKKDESYTKLLIQGKSQKHLDEILETVYEKVPLQRFNKKSRSMLHPKIWSCLMIFTAPQTIVLTFSTKVNG